MADRIRCMVWREVASQALAWRKETDLVGWTHTVQTYSMRQQRTKVFVSLFVDENSDESKNDGQSNEEKREAKV